MSLNHMMQDPTFWVAVSFVGFALVFVKFALPPVLKALDGRSAKIAEDLKQAEALRQEAQDLLSTYQKRQKEAVAEAEEIISTARKQAEAMKAQAEIDLRTQIERRLNQVNERISRTEAEARQGIKVEVIELALHAAEYLIRKHIEDEGKDDSINVAIKDLSRIVH